MKKAIIIMIGLFAILNFSNSAYAWNNTEAGDSVTIGTNNPLTYDPSPGVLINGGNGIDYYSILTGNVKAGADGMVYTVGSASGEIEKAAMDFSAEGFSASSLGTPTTDGTLVSLSSD